ncbi:hypothetical protein, partial [Pelotomaculum propionicicum]|uniref:hypothetical protein n=1 Tax=Pelotomaculum propionicicum TaxID=258475 RepID=UPI00186434A6
PGFPWRSFAAGSPDFRSEPGRREARPPVKKPPTILAGIIGIIILNSASFCLPAFGAGQREGAGRR